MRVLFCLLLACRLLGQGVDGPYVLWRGRTAEVLLLEAGTLQRGTHSAPLTLDLPELLPGPLRLTGRPYPAPDLRLPAPARIAVLSDIHGNYEALRTLLEAHGVISRRGAWRYGKGHLVVLGDLFDRGPRQLDVQWFLQGLQEQARRAGGRVHVLLGNHEMMVLSGDRRYVHPRHQAWDRAGFPGGLTDLYGPDSELGRWIRACPAVLQLGDWLFTHGGISPEVLALRPSLQALDAGVRGAAFGGSPSPFGGSQGPLWYRGLIPGADRKGDAPEAHIAALLAHFRARTLVVGHTDQSRITAYHGGRVIGVDAGLGYGRPGELLILERGRRVRGLPDGSRAELETAEALAPAA